MLTVSPTSPSRPPRRRAPSSAAALAASALLLAAPAAEAAGEVAHVDYPGVQHLHYRYGPIDITPGQNTIVFRPTTQKPTVPASSRASSPTCATRTARCRPSTSSTSTTACGSCATTRPSPTGEEKTITQFPRASATATARATAGSSTTCSTTSSRPPRRSTCVGRRLHARRPPRRPRHQGGQAAVARLGEGNYPVLDAQRGWGTDGRYTFPDAGARRRARRRSARRSACGCRSTSTLVAAGGHLHPGGLYVDLRSTRGGRTKELFRSEAKYYEPAGAVSWDVSMTFTKPDWRVAVRRGDTLAVSATYDTRRASWYEVMGIIDPLWYTTDPTVTGVDPFADAGRLARRRDPWPPAGERPPRRHAAARASATRCARCPARRRARCDDRELHLRPRDFAVSGADGPAADRQARAAR